LPDVSANVAVVIFKAVIGGVSRGVHSSGSVFCGSAKQAVTSHTPSNAPSQLRVSYEMVIIVPFLSHTLKACPVYCCSCLGNYSFSSCPLFFIDNIAYIHTRIL